MEYSRENPLLLEEKMKLSREVFYALRKLDFLQDLLDDDTVTEIMINGYQHIFIEKNGKLYRYPETFSSEEKLYQVVQQIAAAANRMVNEMHPIVDARLEDGSRVNIILPPVSLDGAVMTIRKFAREPMTMEWLYERHAFSREVGEFLKLLVRARYNIFISGGTGSGKTTLLNGLSNCIPKDERIITIEDSAELQIKNIDNLVRLETRNAGPDGSGAITIKDLIKSALRMRPDRIVVGEVRGAEALDMLQAMNTGHDGSLSTGHANSTYDMLSRLETMVLQGAAGLPLEAIRQQIASAVDIIIHLSRLRDKSRKTMQIVEILGYDTATRTFRINPLYEFRESPQSTKEKVAGKLVRTEHPMQNVQKLENAGIYRTI